MKVIHDEDIYYENIDFLTVRLSRFDNPLFSTCMGLVDNSPDCFLDFGFHLEYKGLFRGGKAKIIQIQDSKKNNLGEIRIKCTANDKDYSIHDELEFTSNFFTMYSDYLDYFLDAFSVKKDRQNCIARIDYAIDFLDLSVPDFMNLRKFIPQKQYPVIVDGVTQYFRYENQRHKLVFYNKRLDTLDKKKYKLEKMDGTFPYHKYISDMVGERYITRIEYRKNMQAFRDMEDSSINFVLKNIRTLAIQYIDNHIDLSIKSDYIPYNKAQKIKKDVIFGKEVDRKINMSLTRMDAYMNTYIDLESELKLFKYLSDKFGYRLFDYLRKEAPDSDFSDKIFFDHLKEQ